MTTTSSNDPLLPNRQMTMTLLMTPDMANFSGNVHGGIVLKLLDQVAYACASRYAGKYVVTLSVDQVMFKQPIHVGEVVTFLPNPFVRKPLSIPSCSKELYEQNLADRSLISASAPKEAYGLSLQSVFGC